jgi:hypothetical protein
MGGNGYGLMVLGGGVLAPEEGAAMAAQDCQRFMLRGGGALLGCSA